MGNERWDIRNKGIRNRGIRNKEQFSFGGVHRRRQSIGETCDIRHTTYERKELVVVRIEEANRALWICDTKGATKNERLIFFKEIIEKRKKERMEER